MTKGRRLYGVTGADADSMSRPVILIQLVAGANRDIED